MSTLKYSRQREAVKTFLLNCRDHPTADRVYTCLRKEYPNISLGTVYRNLSLLVDLGEIRRISTGTGAEHYDSDISPHQHFICTCCHKVRDLHLDRMDTLVEAAARCMPGSRIDVCSANFYGVCRDCLETEQGALSPIKQAE